SQTGLFATLSDLTPSPGVIPYDVCSPLWSDGATKRRWVVLPGGERIGYSPKSEWSFPRGTILVKHFELPDDPDRPEQTRWLETRLLVVTGPGGFGATYKWRPDRSDADLLKDGLDEPIELATSGGSEKRIWSYPSRDDCLKCHTTNAGFVLGLKTRQLNRDF